ncbi:hypothetical protein E6W39_29000 [Kitasatospora acidiphila]|uniref:Uncharacterized protein n=1 Tax=Kitasatospora acidiphila TaxID=2567942 RepID=A0A540W9C9_9ACTN|nr:hypothetical protein [Kitasatospora acidiphila]TQF05527.1 hypothetical protein E6W39_29000 [Kitasatospora acidiphila]
MPATYNTDGAEDPDLYAQLMTERYGPLRLILAERNRPAPPRQARANLTPDPRAAEHRHQLLEALNNRPQPDPEPAA